MSTSIRVLEDTIPNAKAMLQEAISLQGELLKCVDALQPFGPAQKAEYGTLPKFIVKSSTVLRSVCISGFDLNYPVIRSVIVNGQSRDDGMRRIHDGLYKVGQLYNRMSELKFAVKLDKDRSELRDLACKAAGDITVYIITQYKLDNYDQGVYLSVTEYCNREGITPAVLYGEMLHAMEAVGADVYGYESISEYRQALIDIDPVFLAECEEYGFPLTSQMSKDIINGTMSLDAARSELTEFLQQMEETEVRGMTPANMVSRMNLS